jgi:hypothetical protein
MTNDSAFLSEVWQLIKSNTPKVSHLEVCDELVSIFDSNNMADGLESEVGLDPTLALAVASYYGIEYEEEDDDE